MGQGQKSQAIISAEVLAIWARGAIWESMRYHESRTRLCNLVFEERGARTRGNMREDKSPRPGGQKQHRKVKCGFHVKLRNKIPGAVHYTLVDTRSCVVKELVEIYAGFFFFCGEKNDR